MVRQFAHAKKYTLDGLHVEIQSDNQSDSWKFMEVFEPVEVYFSTSSIYLQDKGVEVATHIGLNDLCFYYQDKFKRLYKLNSETFCWEQVVGKSIQTRLKRIGG